MHICMHTHTCPHTLVQTHTHTHIYYKQQSCTYTKTSNISQQMHSFVVELVSGVTVKETTLDTLLHICYIQVTTILWSEL